MSSLIINDYPLMVSPKLAVVIGLHEAIFVQQLHWLSGRSKNQRDGHAWVYNTAEEWQENIFPFWSVSTVRRVIKSCEEKGVIVSTSEYNRAKFDKTKWFRVNYGCDALVNASTQNDHSNDDFVNASTQSEQTSYSDWPNGITQNGQIEMPNLSNTIPKTIHRPSIDSHHQDGDDSLPMDLPEQPKAETPAPVQTETDQSAAKRVELCKELKRKGLTGVNPQHPAVHSLVQEFAVSEALFITDELIARQGHSQFSPAYVLTALRNARDSPKREYGNQQQAPKKPKNPSTEASYHDDLEGWGAAGVKTL